MTATDQEVDFTILEDLDFNLKCNLRNACDNDATWLMTTLCCSTEYPACDKHRLEILEKLKVEWYIYCDACYFHWDARHTINLRWTRL